MNLSLTGCRPKNFTNYLSEIKFADPILGEFSVSLFWLWWNFNYFKLTYFRIGTVSAALYLMF